MGTEIKPETASSFAALLISSFIENGNNRIGHVKKLRGQFYANPSPLRYAPSDLMENEIISATLIEGYKRMVFHSGRKESDEQIKLRIIDELNEIFQRINEQMQY